MQGVGPRQQWQWHDDDAGGGQGWILQEGQGWWWEGNCFFGCPVIFNTHTNLLTKSISTSFLSYLKSNSYKKNDTRRKTATPILQYSTRTSVMTTTTTATTISIKIMIMIMMTTISTTDGLG